MTHAFHIRQAAAALAALAFAGLVAITPARATMGGGSGISGFSDFTLNQGGPASTAPSISGSALEITEDGVFGQYNSAICDTPQNIGNFTASFVYQESYNPEVSGLSPADGATFVIENDPRGVNAFGFGGSDLGYAGQFENASPITNSVAIALNIYNGHIVGTNLLTGGDDNGVYLTTPPVSLKSGDPILVSLVYNGTKLTETLTDEHTLESVTKSYTVDIPTEVGGSTAYIGFTGATGGGTATQTISDFSYSSSSYLSFAPNPVLGGNTSIGTIHLSAPVSKLTPVHLASSDPINAAVSPTVDIASGHSTVTFKVTTQGIPAPEGVTITATLPTTTLEGALTISAPSLVPSAIEISGNPVVGGNYTFGSVTISSPAPFGGVAVDLTTKTDPYSAVTGFWSGIPGTLGATQITYVTIPQGETSADFVINTQIVPKDVNIQVQGTLNGTTRGATLTVQPVPAG